MDLKITKKSFNKSQYISSFSSSGLKLRTLMNLEPFQILNLLLILLFFKLILENDSIRDISFFKKNELNVVCFGWEIELSPSFRFQIRVINSQNHSIMKNYVIIKSRNLVLNFLCLKNINPTSKTKLKSSIFLP